MYGPHNKSAQDILDQLAYYTPETPWSAREIGMWLGLGYGLRHDFKPESIRRAARRVMAAVRKLYPDKVGSCARGHFLIQTAQDRNIDREFRRNHALTILYNVRRRPAEQPSLPLQNGWSK